MEETAKNTFRFAGVDYSVNTVVSQAGAYPQISIKRSEIKPNPDGLIVRTDLKLPVIVIRDNVHYLLISPRTIEELNEKVVCKLATKYALKKAVPAPVVAVRQFDDRRTGGSRPAAYGAYRRPENNASAPSSGYFRRESNVRNYR